MRKTALLIVTLILGGFISWVLWEMKDAFPSSMEGTIVAAVVVSFVIVLIGVYSD